jgi:hypothetical protein
MRHLRCSIAPRRCVWRGSSASQRLREQLEATRKLRFHKSELIWLAGNTFYGRRGIFEPAFLEWLERDFRLSDFDLSVQDGQIALSFQRPLDRDDDVGDLRALGHRRTEDARQPEAAERVRTRHSVCARQDQTVGKDGAAARRSQDST